jgi:hypothetical protein
LSQGTHCNSSGKAHCRLEIHHWLPYSTLQAGARSSGTEKGERKKGQASFWELAGSAARVERCVQPNAAIVLAIKCSLANGVPRSTL